MFSWFVCVIVIQEVYRVIGCFHVCFACLSERKNLRGRLMLSTPSLLSWKKLGDDLNCWLAHYEPQKGMVFCQWKLQILGKVSSMFLLGRLMSIAKEKRWKTFQHIHDLGSAPVLHSSLANKLWRRLTGSTPHPKKDAKSRWGMLMFPEGLVRTTLGIPSLGLVPNDRCKMCLQVLSLSTCPPSHGGSSNSKPLSIKWVDCQRSIYLRLEMHIYFASHHFLGSIPTNLPDLHIWRRLNAKFACSCFGQLQECLNYKPQNSSKLPVRHTRFLTSMGDSFTPFQPLRICPTGP